MDRPDRLRLTHPDLDFHVDVTVHERDVRYMATADLGEDSRDVGGGDTPQEAVRAALRSRGSRMRRRLRRQPIETEGLARGDHDRMSGGLPRDPQARW